MQPCSSSVLAKARLAAPLLCVTWLLAACSSAANDSEGGSGGAAGRGSVGSTSASTSSSTGGSGGAGGGWFGPCPPDMALIEGFCMDPFEAPNIAGEKPLVMQSA